MATNTNYDTLIEILKKEGKPLQRADFRDKLPSMEDSFLGILLSNGIKKRLWVKIKYPGMYGFYAHPDWVKDGELKDAFDPIFKSWKKDQQHNGTSTEPTGVPNA